MTSGLVVDIGIIEICRCAYRGGVASGNGVGEM